MYLIVGLGNPGLQYEHTRHNAGFEALDCLAGQTGIRLSRKQCRATVGEGIYQGNKLVLAKPDTFMNLSGEAVSALLRYYKLDPGRLVVIYDDIDLPPQALRLRGSGGPGTHNGMRSIVACLGTEAFPRVRIGVGAPPPGYDLAKYVLGRIPGAERDAAAQTRADAAAAALAIVEQGLESAMQRYNTKRKEKPAPPGQER